MSFSEEDNVKWPSCLLELNADALVFPPVASDLPDDLIRDRLLDLCFEALAATSFYFADRVVMRGSDWRVLEHRGRSIVELGPLVAGDWFRSPGPAGQIVQWIAGTTHVCDTFAVEAFDTLQDVFLSLQSPELPDRDDLALTRMAFHAGFNPVLLYPEVYCLGELFTVSAWLGMLARGRKSILPEFIASYLLMLLSEDSNSPSAAWGPDAFVLSRADEVVGLDVLGVVCNYVLDSGPALIRPKTVRPRHPRLSFVRSLSWARLAH